MSVHITLHAPEPELTPNQEALRRIAYEEVTRVEGRALCVCGAPYRDHTVIADGGFRRACDGKLVKT